jgi:hypothetical protein
VHADDFRAGDASVLDFPSETVPQTKKNVPVRFFDDGLVFHCAVEYCAFAIAPATAIAISHGILTFFSCFSLMESTHILDLR